MAEVITSPVTRRCAIVTGANKGIGFEICRQLAANGIMVVLTARDEKRGVEALDKLRVFGLSDCLIFHQLDVTDPTSVASLVKFIKTRFGKLDILRLNRNKAKLNNAGSIGLLVEGDVAILEELIEKTASRAFGIIEQEEVQSTTNGSIIETCELAEQCIEINYYGVKRIIEAFIPLLQLSDSPRIVNVSSGMGMLKLLSNEWAIGMLSDVESLTEERVEEVLNEFLKNFKEGTLQVKDWPLDFSAYKVSKAAMNAYTRIVAKKYPSFYVNCVSPGYVRTDMTGDTGRLSVEEGAESPVKLALSPDGGPSGIYFHRQQVISF